MRRLVTLALLLATALPASAQTCTSEDFAKAVDAAGAGLRQFNLEMAPKLQSKLKQLAQKHGWSENDYQELGVDYLQDARLASFDANANELLGRIDTLGRPPAEANPDCARLDELKAAGIELMAVMKAKTAYTIGKIDLELGAQSSRSEPAAATPPPASAPAPLPAQKQATAPLPPTPPAPPAKPTPPPPPARPAPPTTAWTTQTSPAQATAEAQPPPAQMLPDDGYTIDEIREATRGFFGTISTNLASVLEHAFRKSGRPSAYVLGQEGGGAFLAGLRYGDGTLYLRAGGSQKVYWHGPSLGYDFGAEGSRTLFLIYNLPNANALYRRFTGIDGSAYLVGGVGITYLAGGDVVMAPIRSGVGLRLGASVSYIRFSPTPTWNPF